MVSPVSDVNESRFRLMNEGFGGIKDVLMMGETMILSNVLTSQAIFLLTARAQAQH